LYDDDPSHEIIEWTFMFSSTDSLGQSPQNFEAEPHVSLSNMAAPKSENVKVVVRCRPLSQKERDAGYYEIVKMNAATRRVALVKKPDDPSPK
jgi:hypothetical protein